MRQQQRTVFLDLERTNFEERVVAFKKGFVNIEYYAHKKLLEEIARVFRDFPDIGNIKIIIVSSDQTKEYFAKATVDELEQFLNVNFYELHQDIKVWREFLNSINKPKILEFASKFVQVLNIN